MNALFDRLQRLVADIEDIKAMAQREEAKFYDGDGPGWPAWATHRLVLPNGTQVPPVVYFGRQPKYAEVKAFAAAAAVPAASVEVEARE